jgi:hypothetical protein
VRPEVIVATQTPPETVTVAQEPDDTQLTMLIAIFAFGDSIAPMFITNNKTFEQTKLAEEQLSYGHDSVIRTAPKMFMIEVLFIDWLQNLFIPRNALLRAKMNYVGPIILLSY